MSEKTEEKKSENIIILDYGLLRQVSPQVYLRRICTEDKIHLYISNQTINRLEAIDSASSKKGHPLYVCLNVKRWLDYVYSLATQKKDSIKSLFNGGLVIGDVPAKGVRLSIKPPQKSEILSEEESTVKKPLLDVLDLALDLQKQNSKHHIAIHSTQTTLLLRAERKGFATVKLEPGRYLYMGFHTPKKAEEQDAIAKGLAYLGLSENEFVANGSNYLIKKGRKVHQVKLSDKPISGIKPKNIGQKMYAHLLLDDSITVVTAMGIGGTGKTLLPLAMAIEKVLGENKFEKIIVARAAVAYEETGFKPGNAKEKVLGFMKPIHDNLQFIKGQSGVNKSFVEKLIDELFCVDTKDQKEDPTLVVMPLEEVQGRTFHNSIVIIDEAENLSEIQAISLLTRIGNNSKIIFSGDIGQLVQTPQINEYTNGLTSMIRTLRDQPLHGHIHLTECERSKTAALGDLFLK